VFVEKINYEKLKNLSRREFYFSPSKAGDCPRALFYEAKGVEPDQATFLPVTPLVFTDGVYHEKDSIQLLSELPGISVVDVQKPVNVPIPKKFAKHVTFLPTKCPVCGEEVPPNHLHGHVDGVIKTEDSEVLLEHKALSSRVIHGFLKKGVSKGYAMQVALYLKGLNLKSGILLVKNKETGQLLEFEMHYDRKRDVLHVVRLTFSDGSTRELNHSYDKITTKAFQKFALVEKAVKLDRLPVYDTEEASHCFLCPYRRTCEEDLANQQLEAVEIDVKSLESEEREAFLKSLQEYLRLNDAKKEIDEKVEKARNELVSFMNKKNCKKVIVGGIPVSLITTNREVVKLDVNSLKEHLGEQFKNFVMEERIQQVQYLKILPKHKPRLVEKLNAMINDHQQEDVKEEAITFVKPHFGSVDRRVRLKNR
jgi:hypothetical protein